MRNGQAGGVCGEGPIKLGGCENLKKSEISDDRHFLAVCPSWSDKMSDNEGTSRQCNAEECSMLYASFLSLPLWRKRIRSLSPKEHKGDILTTYFFCRGSGM